MSPSPTRAVLERPGFRRLTRAWLAINAADAALFLMLAAWTKDLTGSDPAAAGVLVALGVPALFAPALGQIADRMSRVRLMVITCALSVPVLFSLALVDGPGKVWLIYLVTFLYGCVGYLVGTAQSGLVRDLLADDELAAGNGLLSTIDMALRLVSPAIGTGLYVWLGPLAVVFLSVIGFAVGGFLLHGMEIQESPPAQKVPGEWWREMTAGFRQLWANPVLRRLTILLGVAFGAIGMVNATVFPAMEKGFQVEPATLGVFISLQGVGSVLGGVTAARVIRVLGEPRAVGLGMAATGIGFFPLAGTSLALGVVGLLVMGLGIPWIIVGYTTIRQRLTPPELQGRTSAAANLLLNAPQTGVLAISAGLLAVIDYRLLVLATVLVVLLSAMPLRNAEPV
jgi:hypothetical protein